MLIQRMRCYFFYNVPVAERLLDDDCAIGASAATIEKLRQHFEVQPAEAPAFYTHHYRTEHTPYLIGDPANPTATYIPAEKVNPIDFYAGLNLTRDIAVHWEFMLSLQGPGLITLCLEIDEPLPSSLAYRLSGLYLNVAYTVIATEPVKFLWEHPHSIARPEFVTPDQLARAVHAHFFQIAGLTQLRHRALKHEIQIPLTAIEVDTEHANQSEFIEKESLALAELVFKPACWEVAHTSLRHANRILDESRLWSVARDSLFVAAYEGALYVKLRPFDLGVSQAVSGFNLASEAAVLYTYKVALANYHFLRILDDQLDREMHPLVHQVLDDQRQLQHVEADYQALQDLDAAVIRINHLHYELDDLLEEINNSDKLIDEEWHIVLLDKLNTVLGTRQWYDSVNRRVDNLRQLAQTIERTYGKLADLSMTRNIEHFNAQLFKMTEESQKVGSRLQNVQPFFEALAAVEALNLLINIWFDSNYPMTRTLNAWLNLQAGVVGKVLGTGGVILALAVIIMLIRWFTQSSRRPPA